MVKKLGLWLLLLSLPILTNASQDVIFNKPLSPLDPRYKYTYELMELIFKATPEYTSAQVKTTEMNMTRSRIFLELKKGNLLNVVAEAPQKEWDSNLIAVPIPIRKGLQGFRVFIIKDKNREKLVQVDSLQSLTALYTGSGNGWSTRLAMEQAGFVIVTASGYESLFAMLSKQRFTTFGRGINEAYQEVESHLALYPDLVVDNRILLEIPLATYFYVSPSFPEIADRIRVGLLRLIESGEFDQFFFQKYCSDILKANMPERMRFKIDNPQVSQERMISLVGEGFLLDSNKSYQKVCLPMTQ
ncbi:hypothetical protein H4J59_03060 [Colwellia sp. MB02u-10]|uniref:hypothetical protein n=1 Tax=Colwellia sp. MB02u-10 TaxID=2759828 RepID=UPI0015F52661|nr:hypothetical protein [Colwellia sp. MB02u-10]MBA6339982.1 hypothetical protein [Colwellia sp. MB02u-10]